MQCLVRIKSTGHTNSVLVCSGCTQPQPDEKKSDFPFFLVDFIILNEISSVIMYLRGAVSSFFVLVCGEKQVNFVLFLLFDCLTSIEMCDTHLRPL